MSDNKKNKVLNLNLALNYGAKAELINAINLTIKNKVPITESNLEKNLINFVSIII